MNDDERDGAQDADGPVEDLEESVEQILERGHATFHGHRIAVERGVLVPRRVTEVLVTVPLELLDRDGAHVIVDMGTGSGNVGVALAHAFPAARVYSTDLSEACVALAARNAAAHGLAHRMTAHAGDLFGALSGLGLEGGVHLVTCSPPFISTGRLAKDRAHLLEHEPREAFDAGPYGMALHQRLVREAVDWLVPGVGWLVLEHGEGQERLVKKLFERAVGCWAEVRTWRGPAGFDNCVAGRRA